MINAIIDGLCIKLNEVFGDNYEIYTETVKQGLTQPCFSIVCINPTQEQFLGKRYHKSQQFCIHYFPSSIENKAEINSVSEQLFNALEYITVSGDIFRGTKMAAESDDLGILNFFVTYDFFVQKVVDTTVMENYDYKTDVKG